MDRTLAPGTDRNLRVPFRQRSAAARRQARLSAMAERACMIADGLDPDGQCPTEADTVALAWPGSIDALPDTSDYLSADRANLAARTRRRAG